MNINILGFQHYAPYLVLYPIAWIGYYYFLGDQIPRPQRVIQATLSVFAIGVLWNMHGRNYAAAFIPIGLTKLSVDWIPVVIWAYIIRRKKAYTEYMIPFVILVLLFAFLIRPPVALMRLKGLVVRILWVIISFWVARRTCAR